MSGEHPDRPGDEPPGHGDRRLDALRSVGAADSLGARLVMLRPAGAGAMGQVFEATDGEGGPRLAVKLIQDVRDEASLARFTAEAEILETLQHPAIVGYVGHGTTADGDPYLAMQWLDGEDLGRRLQRGTLGVDEAVALGSRIADGLAAAHAAGIIHRDLKPGNIVLVGGEVGRATIVDFGVARRPRSELTHTGQLVGTPGYMAPEQIRGPRGVSGSADLFALGCVLYVCLTGRLPFEAEEVMTVLAKLLLEGAPRVRALRPEVPPRLDALISQLLAKDDAARPSAEQAKLELDTIGEALARGDEAALALVPVPRAPADAEAETVAGPRRRLAPEVDAGAPTEAAPPLRRPRRWRRWAILAALAALPIGGATLVAVRNTGQRAPGNLCHSAAPPLDGVWDAAARRRIDAAFGAFDLPYAQASRSEVERRLDRYAASWDAAREEACLATRVRAAQPEAVLARRNRCLDDRRDAAGALVEALAAADAQLVERAVRAVDGLPPVSACLDKGEAGAAAAGDDGDPRGDGAASDPAHEAVRGDLLVVKVKLLANRYLDALAAADRALTGARTVGDRTLELKSLVQRGRAAQGAGKLDLAVESFRAAETMAKATGDRPDRVGILTALALTLQIDGRMEEAGRALDQAETAAAEPGAPPLGPLAAADIETMRGILQSSAGRFPDALRHYQRALDLKTQASSPDSLLLASPLMDLSSMLATLDRFEEALSLGQRALLLLRQQGDDHPDVATQRGQIAMMLDHMGRFNEARSEMLDALRILRNLYGDKDRRVAATEKRLADLLTKRGLSGEAIEHYQKARDIFQEIAPGSGPLLRAREGLGMAMALDGQAVEAERELRAVLAEMERLTPINLPDIASTHAQLGLALDGQHRSAEAARELAEATRIYIESLGERHSMVAQTLSAQAGYERDQGHHRKALALLERAWRINEAILPPDDPQQLGTGLDIALAQIALGHPARALPYAERALAKFQGNSADDTAMAQWAVALALWDLGRDRDRAVALARSARNILRILHPDGSVRDTIEEIETWLADKPS